MSTSTRRRAGALLALAGIALPTASLAIVPLLAILGKQLLQDMIFNEVKGQLIASLAGMGCKGARLAGLVAANVDKLRPGGGLTGMAGMAGPGLSPGGLPPGLAGGPGVPGGALPPGMPMPGMAGGPGMPGGALPPGVAMPKMPPGAAGGAIPGGAMPGGTMPGGAMPGGAMSIGGGMAMGGGQGIGQATGPGSGRMNLPTMTPEEASDMSQVFAKMQAQVGGEATMTPDQMARAQSAMRSMQRAMEHPLTRPETLAVFDELKSLGVLTDAMHSEARDCILLAPAGSDRQLGQTGAIFKEVLLPQIRDTKAKLSNLTPEQQEELAQGISDALREAEPADRKAFLEGLGQGFFPQAVVDKVAAASR
ncbi:MAG TPA: hypothetical protein VLD85_14355 [Anaeromyxobacteraceae bacterium]|nr:hypothetical protein [Anaeromyxobacteraceae bacterium]